MKLALTSLGMITPVGHDLETTCAAVRAGISRFSELPHYSVLDEELQEESPLLGSPIEGYAEGFNITGFWVRVGAGCLDNLVAFGGLPGKEGKAFWERTGLIAVTPPVNDARFESDNSFVPEMLKDAYLSRLMEAVQYPLSAKNFHVVSIGHPGAIVAVALAFKLISGTALDRVIVLAVDSYLDHMTLDWLNEHDRLKCEQNPVGLIPGEAGACFMLESEKSWRKRSIKNPVMVKQPGIAAERNHFFSEEPNLGIGLATAMKRALAEFGADKPFNGDLISDCNGEEWRAQELGSARIRLGSELGNAARFLFPGSSMGDVGAASAALGICVGARALQRGYASGDQSLVVASSDYGTVGAVGLFRL